MHKDITRRTGRKHRKRVLGESRYRGASRGMASLSHRAKRDHAWWEELRVTEEGRRGVGSENQN